MSCKSHNDTQHRETRSALSSHKRKTRYACIVEAHESARKRTEETQQRDHEDHIADKRFNSLSHYNLVQKPLHMLQATTILDAKAVVDK